MGSMDSHKPHLVCIPYPAQGHVTPMLKLAKLLHSYGFYITFVNTHYNHNRLVKAKSLSTLEALHDFNFESIPDGLPPSDIEDQTQSIPALCESLPESALSPFMDLMKKLNDPSSRTPPVTGIVSDGVMSFTLDAAKVLDLPLVLFWTTSACGFMGYLHYKDLMERGLVPLKDESDVTNGYLETPVEWIPGFKNMRLRDFPSFIRTTDHDDIMLNYCNKEAQRASMAKAVIFNTFNELEKPVLDAMSAFLPPIYTVGPLSLLSNNMPNTSLSSIKSNLWTEDLSCMKWLANRKPNSVVYVNFGSITVMTNKQLIEFAWGLANSKKEFLWVIRPDLVRGDSAVLPQDFVDETRDRCMLASWCPQEAVLGHPAIGGFLTHSGWNSTIESISSGVAMLSWPFFAEQQTNCRYVCSEWGIGMEIDNDVKRGEVEELIRVLMDGEKGIEMKNKAMEWRDGAIRATLQGGSSRINLEKLVKHVFF